MNILGKDIFKNSCKGDVNHIYSLITLSSIKMLRVSNVRLGFGLCYFLVTVGMETVAKLCKQNLHMFDTG
jgi:hypothetical protein